MLKNNTILTEGGNAVQSLIDKKLSQHNKEQLQPSSIPISKLSVFFPKNYGKFSPSDNQSIIGKVLSTLLSKGLIDPKFPPTYTYGSTRLAAVNFYGPQPDLIEKDEEGTIEAANRIKTSYGDLDIDVKFTGDKKEIALAIESIDPSQFACAISSEVHIAVRFDSKHVAQMDLVNADNPQKAKVWQRSSIIDTAQNFKGVLLVTLLRTVAREKKANKEEIDAVVEMIKSDSDSSGIQDIKKKISQGWTLSPNKVGFSLKDRGLTMVVNLQKGSALTSVDIDLNSTVGYDNLDNLAKAILGDTASQKDIMHFVNLTQYIKNNFDDKTIKQIATSFKQNLERLNIPEDLKERGVQSLLTSKGALQESLLLEGGVAGHMSSIIDNTALSVKKIKQMLSAIGNGKITATEKTDGMNAFFSAKNGKALLARNKTDIKTGGWTTETVSERDFLGGDQIKNAFLLALQSFEKTVAQLNPKDQKTLFQDGTIFYNTEIINSATPNTIHYDKNVLSIHKSGHIQYNPETHELLPFNEKTVEKSLNKLTNVNSGEHFTVVRDASFTIPGLKDKRDLKIANAKINKALAASGLTDNSKLEDIIKANFYRYVKKSLPDLSTSIQKLIVANVYDHAKLVLPSGTPPQTKERIRAVKKNAVNIKEKTLAPYDEAILEFSMEILKNVKSAYISNNEKELLRLRQEASKAIKILQTSEDEKKEKLLLQQLQRLKSIDNINSTVEGVVFEYEGRLYKLTGAFAPVNQILGAVKYGDSKISPETDQDEPAAGNVESGPSRVVALLPGGFKPPHAGHYNLAKFFADKKEVDEVFVFISPKERRGHSHDREVVITADMSLALWRLYSKQEPKIKITIAPDNSPVKSVYGFLLTLNDGDTVLLGQSEKEEAGPKENKFDGAEEFAAKNGVHITVKKINGPVFSGNVSGTQVREIIAEGKKDVFFRVIPEHLSPVEKEQAWNIVNSEQKNLNEWIERTIRQHLTEIEDPYPSNTPYQRKVRAKHHAAKKRLIGLGGQKTDAAGSPYEEKPNMKRNKSAPPIGEGLGTGIAKPERGLQDFLNGFLDMTFKDMQRQSSTIRLYIANLMMAGKSDNNSNLITAFTGRIETFLNRFWIVLQKKPLEDIHNPSEEDKITYDYKTYQQVFKEKVDASRFVLRSKTPQEREEGNIKLKQANQKVANTKWSQFIKEKYSEHEKITQEKENHKITEKEVTLDNSPEAQKLYQAYEQLKSTLIKEMSAMSGGAVEGAAKGLFNDEEENSMRTRKDFVEELQLREHIQGLIKKTYTEMLQEKKSQLEEETVLRSAIKSIILEWGAGQLNEPAVNVVHLIRRKGQAVTAKDIQYTIAGSMDKAEAIFNLIQPAFGPEKKGEKWFIKQARNIINQKVLREVDEDIPNSSTGINILAELLTKIIPVIETDYKTLSTTKDQRNSFRAHIIHAIQHLLVTDRMMLNQPAGTVPSTDNAENKAKNLKEKADGILGSSKSVKEGLDVGVNSGVDPSSSNVAETPPDSDAFIDIEKDEKSSKSQDNFTVPGQDLTGRNMALKTFEKINKQITDAYSLLSAESDKEVFYDYLLANVKLYCDKWETELSSTTSEPTNSQYEKEKSANAMEKSTAEDAAKASLGV